MMSLANLNILVQFIAFLEVDTSFLNQNQMRLFKVLAVPAKALISNKSQSYIYFPKWIAMYAL